MSVTAKLKHLRISPRKVRLVANLIKGMRAEEAEVRLRFLPKRAARPILKLLNSAIANAEHNFNLAKENFYISKIIVEEGPSLKRWLPRAMGRATPILKRTSHIALFLDKRAEETKKEKLVRNEKKEEPLRSVVKNIPTRRPRPKKPEKVVIKRRGFKEITRKIFQRKSI